MQKTLIIFLACLLCVGKAYAQKEANIWYFGDGLVWNFPEAKPKVSPQSKLNTAMVRPSFTMSDSLGKLQFYTDGISVWNAKHEAITQNLNGEMAIVATPYPQKKGFYYLFHVGILPAEKRKSFPRGENSVESIVEDKPIFKLYYSLLDVQNNKIVEENVLINNDILADICIARHAEKGNYWLIAHANKSNQFFAYPITAKGFELNEGKASNIGKQYEIGGTPQFSPHLLKSNILGTKILVNRIGLFDSSEVYDFDNQKGNVLNMCIIKLEASSSVMGAEFSPNGRFVYIAQSTSLAVHVRKYDLKSAQPRDGIGFVEKNTDGGFTIDVSNQKDAKYFVYRFCMQLAPNGNIYLSGVAPITILKPNQHVERGLNTRMLEVPNKAYRMPNIAHLLPTGFAREGSDLPIPAIEVGKPFVREILFETNQAILKPAYEKGLQDIVDFLLKNPKMTIEISGHTDNEGEESKNKTLSENRAQALANFLINNKIDKSRIKAIGYGSSKPIADNSSPAGKAKNRRIEFLIK